MMTIKTYLAASALEGLGVFAGEAVEKGRTIWVFDPRFDKLIPKSLLVDAPPCLREYLERYGYDHYEDGEMIALDADDAIYMNHADDPNCDISIPFKGVAARDIAAGEEITCDYRTFMHGEVPLQKSRNRAGAQR